MKKRYVAGKDFIQLSMNYFLLSSSNRVSFTITTKHNNTQHCKHNSLIKMRVIVVGGGIGGLTVANCLKKCGIGKKNSILYFTSPSLSHLISILTSLQKWLYMKEPLSYYLK